VRTVHACAAQPEARAVDAPSMCGVCKSADSTVGRRPRPPRSASPLAPALFSHGAIKAGGPPRCALRACSAAAVRLAGRRCERLLWGRGRGLSLARHARAHARAPSPPARPPCVPARASAPALRVRVA
jgi:hypothetical protein